LHNGVEHSDDLRSRDDPHQAPVLSPGHTIVQSHRLILAVVMTLHLSEITMDKLLTAILDAHGGLKPWTKTTQIAARMSLGGVFWAARGWPDVYAAQTVTLDPHREHITFGPEATSNRVQLEAELRFESEEVAPLSGWRAHGTAHALRQLFSSIAKASARTGPAKRGRHPFDESCRMGAERVRMPKSERHGRAPLEQGTFQVCGD
jgi:hypothetical protein